MNRPQHTWFVLLIVVVLLLSSVAPALAQDEPLLPPDDSPYEGSQPAGDSLLYLPMVRDQIVSGFGSASRRHHYWLAARPRVPCRPV